MQDHSPSEEGAGDFAARFAVQVQRIRESDLLGRSDPLQRLFDYLVSRGGIVGASREFEIADAIGKGFSFDPGQDSSIRVYVHRLRKKLDEFYITCPDGGDRLSIPRGTYRLIMSTVDAPEHEVAGSPPSPAALDSAVPTGLSPKTRTMLVAVTLAVAMFVAIVAGTVGYYSGARQGYPKALAATSVWHPLVKSPLRTFYVLGDQALEGGHPHVVLNGSVKAFARIMPVANALISNQASPSITGSSFIVPASIKESNLIYIGTFSQMGILQDVIFARSNYQPNESGVLINRETKRQYVSAPPPYVQHRQLVSYGYLACLIGANGNRIIIISGATDGAVVQMAENATNAALLKQLSAQAGPDFEALYSVATVDEANVQSHLESVRPLGK